MVLLNDEIVNKLHLLEKTKKVSTNVSKNVSKNITNVSNSFSSMNFILGGILGIIILLCFFININIFGGSKDMIKENVEEYNNITIN